MFDDDWENAVLLYPRGTGEGEAATASYSLPPVTLLVVSVGGNIFFDPTREELAVGDVVLVVSICGGRVVGVRTLEGGGGGVSRDVVKSAVRESLVVADEVLESLKGVIEGG
jgi:exosome complex component RRP42